MGKNKTELLLPVGNLDMCLAAIHNGADAIYVGMPYFNARGRTIDLGFPELKEIIDLCHLYRVKVYLAFNVLIFEAELPRVIELLHQAIELGPDAFILQDLGLAKLIKDIAPDQRIHASTQMTISNFEAIEFLDDLEIDRFVLARECSLKDISHIKKNTQKELEVFVHGALCVSYSGQCFTSEALGGRSANRGQCAQSCRFDYELIVDGNKKDLIDKKYLVSPQDLCGLNEITELTDIGVDSFKIEGRLKTPEYVASTARAYREVLNQKKEKMIERKDELSRVFSRGFYSGWLHGVDHQKLVEGTYGNHRGLELGKIINIFKRSVIIDSKYIPNPGDGVLFVGKDIEFGGDIFQIKSDQRSIYLEFSKTFNLKLLKKGMRVFLNKDTQLNNQLKKTYTDQFQLKRFPLHIKVSGKESTPLNVEATDGQNTVTISSKSILQKSIKSPLSLDDLQKGLGSLGHTCFYVKKMQSELLENLYLSHKELKYIKKNMVEQLYSLRILRNISVFQPLDLPRQVHQKTQNKPKLNLLFREIGQLKTFIEYYTNCELKENIGNIILDYEFGQKYEESVKLLRQHQLNVYLATTRILKPYEYHNLRQLISAKPDGILVRNLGAVNFLQKNAPNLKLKGDFSLNVTNSFTAKYLKSKGLETLCPGYDLNQEQLSELLKFSPSNWYELTVHQYMPEFHMEHCVFAAFLSNGSSFQDCGKPCEKHKVELKDMYGNYHYLKADQECRNTMYLSTPQAAFSLIPKWQKQGVCEFRFEALFEKDQSLINKIHSYLQVISGQLSPHKAFSHLNLVEKFGVTLGQLTMNDNYKSKKQTF